MAADGPKLISREEFTAQFEHVVRDVVEDLKTNPMMTEHELPGTPTVWVEELMRANMLGGKLVRGISVVRSYQILVWSREKRELTEGEIRKASAVGWGLEALQASFLVSDDIMDASLTRRGLPCWYQRKHPLSKNDQQKIGLTAVNDALLIESIIYVLLRAHFAEQPETYIALLHEFHAVTYQTEIGQFLDMSSQPTNTSVDIGLLNMDTYMPIVRFKTSFYSFYLPVALGLILGGERNPKAFGECRRILVRMGEFFQIQDDFLDCYGDPAVTGKVGRDIEEKKCSWLAVQAVSLATEEQKATIQAHYGVDNPEDVKIIKALFNELGLEKRFRDYEEATYHELCKAISETSLVPKDVYNNILGLIYKRQN